MSKLLYRVKSNRFTPAELDGKTLRYFRCEQSCEYTLHVHDPHPDGTYILQVTVYSVSQPASGHEAGKMDWEDVSLDQNTVDRIELAGTSAHLRGANFVIFDQSPESRQMCSQ